MSTKAELKRKKCVKCGKTMKRVAWYYRNNEYFCGKGCFAAHDKIKKEKAAKAKEEAAKAKEDAKSSAE